MIYKTKSGTFVDINEVYVIKYDGEKILFFTQGNKFIECKQSDETDFLEIADFKNNCGGFHWCKGNWSCDVSSILGIEVVEFDLEDSKFKLKISFHQDLDGISLSNVTQEGLDQLIDMYYKSRGQDIDLQNKIAQKGAGLSATQPRKMAPRNNSLIKFL